jgi:hypothetical protein
MKHYRIKKVTDKYSTRYYPQHKLFGLFWMNIIFPIYSYGCGSCDTLEDAQDAIREHSSKPVVEYIEVE